MLLTRNFRPGVVFDTAPLGHNYGDTVLEAHDSYTPGSTVEVEFWSAHPNNNFQTQNSYLYIQHFQANGDWKTVLTDGDWDTTFRWRRHLLSESIVTISWEISDDTPSGRYRIVHNGVAKSLTGLHAFNGTSRDFVVTTDRTTSTMAYFTSNTPVIVVNDSSGRTLTLALMGAFVAVVVVAAAVVAIRRHRRAHADPLAAAYQQVNP
eukprot:JP446379.1.p1 GENE.JP446379.1~~JP446379.1.p1  ORF type:complete len:207 (+),score=38.31 JP446379.1:377-997(+)